MINVQYDDIRQLVSKNVLSSRDAEEIARLNAKIAHNQNNLGLRLKKAFILFQAHCDDQAIDELVSISQQFPDSVDAHMWLAELLIFHWADAEQAISVLEQALKIDPHKAECLYLLGCAFSKQQKLQDAIDVTQKAVELKPTWPHPRMCLISYLIEAKKIEDAREELLILETYIATPFPQPLDAMQNYYETLITGRYFNDYAIQWLQKLRDTLHSA